MVYKVVYKKSVYRDLKKLPKAEVERILGQIEVELAANPGSTPVLKGRFAGLRKFRIGDYRVIYALMSEHLLVLRIGHRRDIYKSDI